MAAGIERKYIILFAILIALTGFTFESQKASDDNSLGSLAEVSKKPELIPGQVNSRVSTLAGQFTQP